jgi:ABC-type Fe3+/spermidine/putrescine transport system ATPase subunit
MAPRAIAGLETPDRGRIVLHGRVLFDSDQHIDVPARARRIGLLFQNYALFPHLTVFDNIAFGLRLRRVAKTEIGARVESVLRLVDLATMAGRFPAQLSGGQQQRVAIARSLVLEPQILMFDEPLSNLDFKLRIQMRDELKSLQRRLGKTSIYVTHDQTEALALSDRIAVLSHGRIEQIGTPGEIYEQPATSFVAEFIGSSNLLPARVVGQDGQGTIVETAAGLRLRCGVGAANGAEREVSVLLRPERIGVQDPGTGPDTAPNCFAARIAEVTYLGEDLHLSLDLPGGDRLRAALKNVRAARGLGAAQAVEIIVDPNDIRILRR